MSLTKVPSRRISIRLLWLLSLCVAFVFVIHHVHIARKVDSLAKERDRLILERQAQRERSEQIESSVQELRHRLEVEPTTTVGDVPPAASLDQIRSRISGIETELKALRQRAAHAVYHQNVSEYDPTAPPVASGASSTASNVAPPRNWGPEQVVGSPDTNQAGDIPTAWASLEADAGPEWLRTDFEHAVSVAQVRIRETFNPGAIAKVTAIVNGQEMVLWQGSADAGRAPRDFVVPVSGGIPTQSIIVHLDTARVPGWNEIDAVELVGSDGSRQWAVAATASTTYAEPSAAQDGVPSGEH